MDFSYFNAAAAQPYQFIGLPPTPAYSGAGNDGTLGTTDLLDPSFLPPYDAYIHFGQATIPATTTSASAGSPLAPNSPDLMPVIGSVDSGLGLEGMEGVEVHTSRSRRSSTEEKEALTPAQSRRKAQNRAAQRAFRERKERHVKDLEAKLSALESSASSLQSDNERLKLALQRATTENEILRATSQRAAGRAHRGGSGSTPASPSTGGNSGVERSLSRSHARNDTDKDTDAGEPAAAEEEEEEEEEADKHPYTTTILPPSFSSSSSSSSRPSLAPTPFSSTSSERTAHRTTRPLSAGAAWDLIQSHPLAKQGLVDIADVCDRLRRLARCSGVGPVFAERDVWRAVEEGRRGGGDELI